MTDVAALRTALAANLEAIDGVQVSPYALSDPTPPGIQILPADVDYDLAFGRGADLWRFTVQPFVNFSSDVGSQIFLDELLNPTGPRSVKTAIESDRTLGGIADNVWAKRVSGYRLLDRPGGTQLIMVEFSVEVLVSN